MLAAAITVVVIPMLIAPLRALMRGWRPLGDNALLLVRSVDVGTEHHPLLGSWSSSSLAGSSALHNPGPLYQDLVALPVRALGPWSGLAVGVTLINVAAVVLALVGARRIGGRPALAVTTVGTAALTWTLGSELLFDIWQPNALVLPALAFLVMCWGLAAGDLWFTPLVVALASLLVQTHLSYVYVVPLMMLTTIAVGVVRWRRRARHRRPDGDTSWRAPAAVSALTAIVLWSQPVYQQLFGPGPGNLSELLSAAGSQEPGNGAGMAVRVAAAVIALPPWWMRSSYGLEAPARPSLVLGVVALALVLAGLAAVAVGARRRQETWLEALATVAGAAVVAAVVSLTLTPSPLGLVPHQWRYLWPVATMVTVTAACGITCELRRWWSSQRLRTVGLGAACAVTVALAVANIPTHAAQTGPTADRQATSIAIALLDRFQPPAGDGPLLFDTSTLRFADPYGPLVLAELQERGIGFVVDDPVMIEQLGRSRSTAENPPATRRFWVRSGPGATEGDDGELLASADGLTDAERAERDRLEDTLARPLRERGLRLTDAGRQRLADGTFPTDAEALQPGRDVLAAIRFAGGVVREGLVEVPDDLSADLGELIDLWTKQDRFTIAIYAAPVGQRPDP